MIQIKRWRAYRALRSVYKFLTDARYRSVALIRFEKPPNLFDPFIATSLSRYPALFSFARDTLGDSHTLQLLSFGCSTGEEVSTLRSYFPTAAIKGIDINRRNIAICKARQNRLADAGIIFEAANSTRKEPDEFYDAIFCLAVLRRGKLGSPGIQRSDPLLYFEAFEKTIGDFARCLKMGGILVLAESNFRFRDTAISSDFEILLQVETPEPNLKTPLFGRDNRRLPDSAYGELAFRKVRGAHAAERN